MRTFAFAWTACLLVPLSLTAGRPGEQAPERSGEPYALAVCPVSGKKLGEKGDPVIKAYEGREVRYCCDACPPKFEKDLAKSLAQVDDKIIKDQLPLYPLKSSIVSKKPLPEKPVDLVWGNRLIRLVDATEKDVFLKEPGKFMTDLNKAVADEQRKSYPVSTCLVGGDELGSMGETREMVIAGRLFRLCCSHCKSDLVNNPAKFIAALDEARKPKPAGPESPKPAK